MPKTDTPTVEDGPLIYRQLNKIMEDVRGLAKRDRNSNQGFNFRGIDAVVNALGPAMRNHQVIPSPKILSSEYVEVKTFQGKPSTAARVVVEYTFQAADGSSISASVAAEAWDTGDKPLALDTPIPTPTGWTTMGQIEVGDYVYDMDGQPVRVINVSEIKSEPCMKVTLGSGEEVIATEDHDWWVRVHGRKNLVKMTTAEVAALRATGEKVAFPATPVLQAEPVALPIDPWVLGYWLGNGSSASSTVTSGGWAGEVDAGHVRSMIAAGGYRISSESNKRAGTTTHYIEGLRKSLAELGLLGHKHIPSMYLRAGVEQRAALLRGMMDSDGCGSGGTPLFVSTNEGLARGFYELATSLGQAANIWSQPAEGFGVETTAWRVKFLPSWGLEPFALPRKARLVKSRQKRGSNNIRSIEAVETVDTRCITVDSPTSSFLVGRGMIPTHNCMQKAMSIAFRTVLLQVFALPTDEPDPDAMTYVKSDGAQALQRSEKKPISKKQAAELSAELLRIGKAPDQHAAFLSSGLNRPLQSVEETYEHEFDSTLRALKAMPDAGAEGEVSGE